MSNDLHEPSRDSMERCSKFGKLSDENNKSCEWELSSRSEFFIARRLQGALHASGEPHKYPESSR